MCISHLAIPSAATTDFYQPWLPSKYSKCKGAENLEAYSEASLVAFSGFIVFRITALDPSCGTVIPRDGSGVVFGTGQKGRTSEASVWFMPNGWDPRPSLVKGFASGTSSGTSGGLTVTLA